MQIGLDWGTTNSSAAVYDGRGVRLLALDPISAAPEVLRSALFISREGEVVLGRAAIDRYTEGNVGREIEYQRTYIGTTELTLADVGTVKQALFADIDVNAPGRLFVSIKLALISLILQTQGANRYSSATAHLPTLRPRYLHAAAPVGSAVQ